MDWETLKTTLQTILRHLAVYQANGVFVSAYWLLQHAAQLGALVALGAIALLDYTEARRLNLSLDARPNAWRVGWRQTALVAGLWLLTAFSTPAPVPVLGLVMVLVTAASGWLDPAERYQHLRRGKGALTLYALATLGLRAYLALNADVFGWAATLGSVDAALSTLEQGRGLVQMIAMLAILYGIPLSYLSWVVQAFISRPASLVAPGQTLQDVVHALRTRDGLSL